MENRQRFSELIWGQSASNEILNGHAQHQLRANCIMCVFYGTFAGP